MGTDTTLQQMNDVLRQFSEKVSALKDQPASVDDAFHKVTIAAGSLEGSVVPVIGSLIVGTYASMTNDDLTGYFGSHREQIKNKIQEVLNLLSEAIAGLAAPIAFITLADDWYTVKSAIGEAQNDEVNHGAVTGYWQGAAADRYGNARSLQDTAMDSTKALCDTAHSSLVSISNACWTYYTDTITQLTSLISSLVAAIAKISAVVTVLQGISSAIDCLKIAADGIAKSLKTLGDSLIAQHNAITAISNSTQNPKGYDNNKWPQKTSQNFNANTPSTDWQAE